MVAIISLLWWRHAQKSQFRRFHLKIGSFFSRKFLYSDKWGPTQSVFVTVCKFIENVLNLIRGLQRVFIWCLVTNTEYKLHMRGGRQEDQNSRLPWKNCNLPPSALPSADYTVPRPPALYSPGLPNLGLSTSCSATFWQLLVFRATFFVSSNFLPSSEQFLKLYSNSEISEQLLGLKLVFPPYFTMFTMW